LFFMGMMQGPFNQWQLPKQLLGIKREGLCRLDKGFADWYKNDRCVRETGLRALLSEQDDQVRIKDRLHPVFYK
jgi:hypothetical protein